MYKHPAKHLYTWSSTDGKTQYQIDFIIFPNDQRGSIKNCSVCNSVDIYSDHSLFMPKYLINIPEWKFPTRVPRKYDVAKQNNEDFATDFEIRLGRAFELLLNTDRDLEKPYEKVVSVTNETIEDLVGYKKRKIIENMSEANALSCEERRKLRKKMINTPKI